MRISNENIIESARRQRQSVNRRMSVEPWHSPNLRSKYATAMGIAASLISFFAGYAFHISVSHSSVQHVAQRIQIQHDTIMQVQTIHDTIYQTRIVTKYRQAMLAESNNSTPTKQSACSMLCDDIPYELLAIGR